MLLGVFLSAITVLIYFIYWPIGVILTVFLCIYFIFTLYMYLNNSEILRKEMVEFATSYGEMQGELLRNFDIPYALLDETGKIMWFNDAFGTAVHRDSDYRRSITTIFHPGRDGGDQLHGADQEAEPDRSSALQYDAG